MSTLRTILTFFALHCYVSSTALRIDFGKRTHIPRLSKRDAGTVEIPAQLNLRYTVAGSYFANISIGNPPQTVEVQLDTGSPDLGINVQQACQNKCVGGTFDPSESSSYKTTYPDLFTISYVNNAYLVGDFATDDVSIGDANLKNMTLGISKNSTLPHNIMGLNPTVVVSNSTIDSILPSLHTPLEALVSSGAIQSRLFSVWLNDLSAARGSILFGGIDESKFNQTLGLTQLDMLENAEKDAYLVYQVPLTQMSLNLGSQSQNITLPSSPTPSERPWLPVTIDTGADTALLPPDIFAAVTTHIPNLQKSPQGYGLPCASAHTSFFTTTSISWTLGDPKNASIGITFSLPLSHFVVPVYNPDGSPITQTVDGQQIEICAFGIQPKTSDVGTNLLGDPFIRAMYVVFNPDEGKMAFGQPLFGGNVSSSEKVAVGKGEQIPGLSKVQPDKDAQGDFGSGPRNATVSATGGAPVATALSSGASAGMGDLGSTALMFTVGLSTVVAFVGRPAFGL
ncbi:MAG: hypothetical protein M1820_002076 [Bogoriella megaspora]|nr:MAG: hypothetical protein M1820_002076 [Bogoriella megaspora]